MYHFRRIIGYWLPLAIVHVYRRAAELSHGCQWSPDRDGTKWRRRPAKWKISSLSCQRRSGRHRHQPFHVHHHLQFTGKSAGFICFAEWKNASRSSGHINLRLEERRKPGYVLVGRSLREVEARIDNLTLMLTLTWLCALLASLVVVIFAEYFLLHPKEKK